MQCIIPPSLLSIPSYRLTSSLVGFWPVQKSPLCPDPALRTATTRFPSLSPKLLILGIYGSAGLQASSHFFPQTFLHPRDMTEFLYDQSSILKTVLPGCAHDTVPHSWRQYAIRTAVLQPLCMYSSLGFVCTDSSFLF